MSSLNVEDAALKMKPCCGNVKGEFTDTPPDVCISLLKQVHPPRIWFYKTEKFHRYRAAVLFTATRSHTNRCEMEVR